MQIRSRKGYYASVEPGNNPLSPVAEGNVTVATR